MESIVEAAMEEAVDEGAGELTKEAAVLVLRLRNNTNLVFINLLLASTHSKRGQCLLITYIRMDRFT